MTRWFNLHNQYCNVCTYHTNVIFFIYFQEPQSGGIPADEPAIMKPAEDVQTMKDIGGKKEQSPDELKAEIEMVNYYNISSLVNFFLHLCFIVLLCIAAHLKCIVTTNEPK